MKPSMTQKEMQQLGSRKNQGGFTLLEVLLAVGVSAFLFIGFVQLVDMWTTTLRAEQMAVHLDKVRQAADNYIRGTNPRDLADGEITLDPGFTSFLPSQDDTDGDSLVDSLDGDNNPTGHDIFVNLIVSQDADGNNESYAIYIATVGDAMEGSMALAVAKAIGAEAGVIGEIYEPGSVTAQGVYGTWQFSDVTHFKVPPDDLGGLGQGQVAIHFMAPASEVTGPYIYRDIIPNCDECNKMSTHLNMGYNNISNVDTVMTGNLEVTGSSTFSGATTFLDTATFEADVTVADANLIVQGQMSVIGTLDITNGVDVVGNVAATNAVFEEANALSIRAAEMDLSTMNVTETLRVQVGDLSVATAQDMRVLGDLEASNMSAYQMFVTGNLYANTMDIEGTVNIDGTLDVSGGGGIITVPNVEIQRCMFIAGSWYGSCP